MTYDSELTLIGQTYIKDEIGQQIPNETKVNILCGVKSIGRNEFYNAAVANFKPTLTFVIHAYEYNREGIVEFEGQRYNVIRTYSTSFEELELTCERVIANG